MARPPESQPHLQEPFLGTGIMVAAEDPLVTCAFNHLIP